MVLQLLYWLALVYATAIVLLAIVAGMRVALRRDEAVRTPMPLPTAAHPIVLTETMPATVAGPTWCPFCRCLDSEHDVTSSYAGTPSLCPDHAERLAVWSMKRREEGGGTGTIGRAVRGMARLADGVTGQAE